MKYIQHGLIVVLPLASVWVAAQVSVTDTQTTSFNFGGTVEVACKVSSISSSQASNLVLNGTGATQNIGTLEVWCNNGQNANTEFVSANNGFLVNGSERIAYTLDVGTVANGVDLSNNFTAENTEAGSGPEGTSKTHALKITTQENGLTTAGQYSDTITVTVSHN